MFEAGLKNGKGVAIDRVFGDMGIGNVVVAMVVSRAGGIDLAISFSNGIRRLTDLCSRQGIDRVNADPLILILSLVACAVPPVRKINDFEAVPVPRRKFCPILYR